MEPPVMELEIIAAFDDTEGAAPAHGDLDGDGDMKMSPQLIYTGRSIIHRAASVYQYIYIYRRLIECMYICNLDIYISH